MNILKLKEKILKRLEKEKAVVIYPTYEDNELYQLLMEKGPEAYDRKVTELMNELRSDGSVYHLKTVTNPRKDNIIQELHLFSRPCDEFLSLNAWLESRSERKIEWDDISYDTIIGKDRTFHTVRRESLLYAPQRCCGILSQLIAYHTPGDEIIITPKSHCQKHLRKDQEGNMKENWTGYRDHFVSVTIRDIDHKKKAAVNIFRKQSLTLCRPRIEKTEQR